MCLYCWFSDLEVDGDLLLVDFFIDLFIKDFLLVSDIYFLFKYVKIYLMDKFWMLFEIKVFILEC